MSNLVPVVLLHYFGFLALVVMNLIDALVGIAPVLWPPASWLATAPSTMIPTTPPIRRTRMLIVTPLRERQIV